MAASKIKTFRKCQICGATFLSNASVAKYCSQDCLKVSMSKRYRTQKTKRVKNNSLAEINQAARDAGLTYGKYVALYLEVGK